MTTLPRSHGPVRLSGARHHPHHRAAAVALTFLLCAHLVAAQTEPSLVSSPGRAEDVPFFTRLNRWRLAWIAGTDAWHHAGPAVAWVNLHDTRMSPIVYSGPGPSFLLTLDVQRQRWLALHAITGRYARVSGPPVLPAVFESSSGEADAVLLRRFAAIGLAAGGGVRGALHARTYPKLQNNAFSSDASVSLNAVGRWTLPFTLRSRSFAFHLRADAPLVAWISRSPAYGVYGTASYWAPPTRYLRATVSTGLTWAMRHGPGNTARLTYVWDYYALDPFNGVYPLRVASHTLSLTLGTKVM